MNIKLSFLCQIQCLLKFQLIIIIKFLCPVSMKLSRMDASHILSYVRCQVCHDSEPLLKLYFCRNEHFTCEACFYSRAAEHRDPGSSAADWEENRCPTCNEGNTNRSRLIEYLRCQAWQQNVSSSQGDN